MNEKDALLRRIELLNEIKRRRLESYRPYEKQIEFHNSSLDHRERCFMAGNQLGKTVAGGMEMAMHATGLYPDWYKGRKFDHPVRCWASGNSSETTRDNPQRLLLGDTPEVWGEGSIPASCIVDVKRAKGVSDAADIIVVRHTSGGLSTIKMKTYDQGREKWQGVPIHVMWFDEEPPKDVYTEGTTRTNATQGISYITATPLLGMSEVVSYFYPEPVDSSKGLTTMTIYDAGHYSQEQIDEIIRKTPPHEVEARTLGKPLLGEGLIFPIQMEEIRVAPFEIPSHWARIIGLDFGWDHPTAAVNCAWDRDNDIFYAIGCHKQQRAVVAVHAAAIRPWGKIPVAWPHDGYKHDSMSGEQLKDMYHRHGLKMLPEHATNIGGGFGIEAPIQEMLEAFMAGKLKIFSHLGPIFSEMEQYHRKNGKVVAKFDDAISALRYAWMMRRYARAEHAQRIPSIIDEGYDPLRLN